MFINAGARLLCTSDGVCVIVYVQFSSVGRYGLGGGVLLFILGSNLGGVGPERGLRGGGRGGVVEGVDMLIQFFFKCSSNGLHVYGGFCIFVSRTR